MLSFSVTGSIGCVLATAPDELTLAITSVLTRDGEPLRVAWILCVARETALRTKSLSFCARAISSASRARSNNGGASRRTCVS
jgi:hypothetical protein